MTTGRHASNYWPVHLGQRGCSLVNRPCFRQDGGSNYLPHVLNTLSFRLKPIRPGCPLWSFSLFILTLNPFYCVCWSFGDSLKMYDIIFDAARNGSGFGDRSNVKYNGIQPPHWIIFISGDVKVKFGSIHFFI